MFIGFAILDKRFEQIPENIGSGKRIYSGKFICSSTCHDAILDDTWVSKILIYRR